MNVQETFTAKDFKSDLKPVWCPGCGHFGVLNALNKALAEQGTAPHETVTVSGIGCSSRIPAYGTGYGFHGVHGRALPLASGIKAANPDLQVVVASGDGDGLSIGGNHFLHACRRNMDLTLVIMDNEVYGMTKGQPSPTTPDDWDSALNPGGTGVPPIQPLSLALTAGANFIGRGFALDPNGAAHLILEAVRHPGFSVVQILSPCPTFVPDQLMWKKIVRKNAVEETASKAEAMANILSDDGFGLGIFYRGTARPMAVGPTEAASDALSALEAQFEL